MEGGVGAFTQELARALAALGHEVHVITSRHARPPAPRPRLRDLRRPVDVGFASLHPIVNRWRWPSLASIAEVALRYDLEVVNIQYQAAAYNMRSPMINFLPWRLQGVTRNVVTFHDLRAPYLFPKAGFLRRAAVQFMARRAHGAIATNSADFSALTANLARPVAQIPIGSNVAVYTPNHVEIAEVREQMGLRPDDCLLGYFGFLNASKGADTLLETLARLDERFHLVFIGGQTGASDPTNAAFLAQVRAHAGPLGLDARVHWTGFLADVRVSAHLHAADLLVMPYRDGVSLRRGTLMAALAHGRPLITTTPVTPTPELVHGRNLWLVPVDDAAALADAVQTLAADAEGRARLGAGAAQLAGYFSWDKIAAQTAAFFQTLLPSSR